MKNLTISVNGKSHEIQANGMDRLLDVLREKLGLTGTKEGCGEGECGACSVFMDGVLVNSCLVPIAQVAASKVTTIEGLARDDALHPVQKAFLEKGGAQCGICTPGMIMASIALLKEHPHPTREQMKAGLAGNLCRCTGYVKIFDAVTAAAEAKA